VTEARRDGSQAEFEGLVEVYLTACQIEGKSSETLRSYRETLGTFLKLTRQEGLPSQASDFTAAHVYQFLGAVAATGASLATQWRRQRETRTFFSWLHLHDHISDNPFRKVKNIKVPQHVIRPFSGDDIARLLHACSTSTFKGTRDRAMILTLLDTGLRVGELTALELADLDFETQRLYVRHGKGNKGRVVRFGDQAKEAIERYLREHRGTEPGTLFLTCRRHPLCTNAVRIIFRDLAHQAGVDHVHPHRFRHTFATWAIEMHAREIDVQYLLGHSTPAMVRRYTATYDAEKAARAHAMFSPADHLEERLQGRPDAAPADDPPPRGAGS
jgi:integrase/recombinase XerC